MKTNPSPMYSAHPLEVSSASFRLASAVVSLLLSLVFQDNLLEWHFTIRGPRDTEFEGGVYHGRIVLPPEYPMKPPSIMLLTPNGRFEVRKMICLSISAYHPETWQPAWGSTCDAPESNRCLPCSDSRVPLSAVRLILEALISFMPTPGEGAVGAIDMPAADRRILAQQVRASTPPFAFNHSFACMRRLSFGFLCGAPLPSPPL
jgi:hypothetical protein